MAKRFPILGITMGDPAGVGPEITAKALTAPEVAGPVMCGSCVCHALIASLVDVKIVQSVLPGATSMRRSSTIK